jgi:hypothetical protein
VVDRGALGQVFLRGLQFSPFIIIPPGLNTHTSPEGWTIGPLVAAVQRHRLAPSKWTTDIMNRTPYSSLCIYCRKNWYGLLFSYSLCT